MFVDFGGSKEKSPGPGFKCHSHQTYEKSCRVHGMFVGETSNRLEPTSVRAGAGMVKVSRCNDSANGWAAGGSWLHSRQGKEIFVCCKTSRPVLGPTQPFSSVVTGGSYHGVKHSICAGSYCNVFFFGFDE
jgi:hypothetical protein